MTAQEIETALCSASKEDFLILFKMVVTRLIVCDQRRYLTLNAHICGNGKVQEIILVDSLTGTAYTFSWNSPIGNLYCELQKTGKLPPIQSG